jgi:hypothetical protein
MDHPIENPILHSLNDLIVHLFDHRIHHRLNHLMYAWQAEPDAGRPLGQKLGCLYFCLKRLDGVVTSLKRVAGESCIPEHIPKGSL